MNETDDRLKAHLADLKHTLKSGAYRVPVVTLPNLIFCLVLAAIYAAVAGWAAQLVGIELRTDLQSFLYRMLVLYPFILGCWAILAVGQSELAKRTLKNKIWQSELRLVKAQCRHPLPLSGEESENWWIYGYQRLRGSYFIFSWLTLSVGLLHGLNLLVLGADASLDEDTVFANMLLLVMLFSLGHLIDERLKKIEASKATA